MFAISFQLDAIAPMLFSMKTPQKTASEDTTSPRQKK